MKQITILLTLFILISTNIQAQIAVNEDNSLPDASALMDIKSFDKGLLIPRMTTAQRTAIPSPATGLMVYDNITNSFWYYNVSVWTEITTGVSTVLQDADNDTKIQVEKNADEDKVRVDLDGIERMVIRKNTGNTTIIDLPNTNGNVIIGENTGSYSTSTAINNIFIGKNTGQYNNTGDNNVFFGAYAGNKNTSGFSNIFIGDHSGQKNKQGSNNIFMGYTAGLKNTGGSNNIFTGYQAGYNSDNCFNNLFMGWRSGYDNISGNANVFLGYRSGYSNTVGSGNLYAGPSAGYSNQTGTNNIFLGQSAGYNETGSNKLYIENSNSATPLIYGEFDNNRLVINGNATHNPSNYTFYVNGTAGGAASWNSLSDRRLKTNIQTVPNALSKVLELRGVTYDWKDGREKGNRLGFIAQEVAEILPQVVNTTGEYYTMQYAPLTAVLVEAIQEQQQQIEKQQAVIEQLQKQTAQIDELKAMMTALQAQINENNQQKNSE